MTGYAYQRKYPLDRVFYCSLTAIGARQQRDRARYFVNLFKSNCSGVRLAINTFSACARS